MRAFLIQDIVMKRRLFSDFLLFQGVAACHVRNSRMQHASRWYNYSMAASHAALKARVQTDIKEFAAKDNWRQLPPYFRDGTELRAHAHGLCII